MILLSLRMRLLDHFGPVPVTELVATLKRASPNDISWAIAEDASVDGFWRPNHHDDRWSKVSLSCIATNGGGHRSVQSNVYDPPDARCHLKLRWSHLH